MAQLDYLNKHMRTSLKTDIEKGLAERASKETKKI